jgi:hypothetical protein
LEYHFDLKINIKPMHSITPSPRQPDTLDELNELRYQRRLSYESSNLNKTRDLNLKIKKLRLLMGWSQADAQEELESAIKEFENPFIPPIENPFIKYDLNDEKGNPRGLSLTIHQVNRYWNRREGGLKHTEALQKALE